jgi:TonB family protein
MRCLTISIVLTCCSSLCAQTWSGSGPHRPATESYLSRVGTIIFDTLGAELNKHPERLSGKVKVALRLDRGGQVKVQKILSSTSNQWVQDTALRVVRTVKLPQMPKEVPAEQSHDWVDFQAEWTFERNLPKPAAYAYQTRISELARQPIASELRKYSGRVSGISMKTVFEIDQLGRAHVIQVLSKPPNRWAEEAVRRALSVTKFPPPSKKILDELGTQRVHAEAEFGVNVE